MENILALKKFNGKTKNILLDVSAAAVIYFVPAITHLLNFPVYFIEPMRLMLILAIVHTNRRNAYVIAFSLPIFSLLISGHPSIMKTSLITAELMLNVWLFYAIVEKINSKSFSMFLSILISKVFYYVIKYGLISFALLNSGLVSTPIYIQIVTTILFSVYIFAFYKKNEVKNN